MKWPNILSSDNAQLSEILIAINLSTQLLSLYGFALSCAIKQFIDKCTNESSH